jgi:TP901 family phage tail tape measure protein
VAERNVKVTLSLQMQDFKKGMEEARKATQETGSEAEKLAQKKADFDLLGASAFAMGGVMAAGIGLAVSKFAEFDEAMSQVQASTHESEANMALLKEAALDAGASTVFSATEAANAIEEMGKAGVSTADILGGGLSGALSLAAAGGLDVASAAGIASTAMTQFGLAGSDIPHVADLLAAGAGKAMGDVTDLAAALNQAGLVANATGLSIEETTATLSAFAASGLQGSDAGTSFKTMLQALNPKSKEAGDLMADLGLSAYDASGEFIGMEAYAGKLQDALGGMSAEQRNATLSTIFGSDAVRAATVLYEEGAEGIAGWTEAVDDQGYAAETAAARLDNLKGDIEALGGATDTALIKMGEGANGPLRFFVQALTDVVEGFAGMPAGTQQAALAIGAVVSAASIGAGAFFTFTPKVAEFKAAVDGLGPSAQKGARAVGALTKGLGAAAGFGAAVVVLDKIANSGDKAAASLEETTSALLSNDLGDLFEGLGGDVNSFAQGLELLSGSSINSGMERFGSTLNGIFFGGALSDQVSDTREQFDAVGQSLAQLVSSGEGDRAKDMFEDLAAAAEEQGYSQEQLLELMPAYADALSGVSNEQQIGAGTAEEQAEALAALEGKAEGAGEEISKLADTIRGFGEANFDLRDAQRAVEASVDSFTESLKENGNTFDITTEQGRANEAALDDVAQAYLQAAAAAVEQSGAAESANPILAAGRAEFVRLAQAAGKSADEAAALADALGLVPENTTAAISVTGAETAKSRIDSVKTSLRLAYQAALNLANVDIGGVGSSGGGKQIPKADGGAIYGPGGPRDDLIPARLSNGEHVLTAADVRAMGGQEAVYRFRAGLGRGFADGGAVASSPSVSVSPLVSLQGARLVLNVDGRQMTGFVQEQIVATDVRSGQALNGGKRGHR